MDAVRWTKLETLFAKALPLPTLQRTAFLDEACADDVVLRGELLRLLTAYDRAPDYFRELASSVEPSVLLKTLLEHTRTPAEGATDDPDAGPARRGPLAVGETVSHYRITDRLGGGGMGVVYKAEDTRLQRTVALKFLPPEWSRNTTAKERFIREARAASALDHPNICTVYEIDERDEQLFIAMACYEGETLRERIAAGPLPVDQVVDVARQISQGLAKAHERGIVHRDLKPANVIVTPEGMVKLLDFGLAKTGDAVLTRTGARMGTAAYMSPEQMRGERVDARTDLWSLGVVLYEMLAGERPFRGDYDQALMYAILHTDPEPVERLRPDTPPALARLVDRLLVRQPQGRLASAAEVLAQLRALDAPVGAPSRTEAAAMRDKSIAVLPFADISPGKDNEYFSDGITEEIITDLSKVRSLRVISRTSAMLLKGTQKTLSHIGRELDVRYVLEGSVRKAGNDLRITAQLVDTTRDAHLWTEKYRGTLDDIFEIQETVARSIVGALKVELSLDEDERLGQRPFDDARAYECYIRARQEIWRWSPEALQQALRYLQNGLDLIGSHPLLHAGVAYAHWQYANMGIDVETNVARAEEHLGEVFRLDSQSAFGYRIQGLLHVTRHRVREGIRDLQQSIELDPNNPDTLSWLAMMYGYVGTPERGYALAERLLRIDPLNPINHGVPGWLHFVDGRFEETLNAYRTMYAMDAENPGHRLLLAQALAYNGRTDECVEVIDALLHDTPQHPFALMCHVYKHALLGDREQAIAVFDPALEAIDDLNYTWFLATAFALAGERERALDYLERSIQAGFINYQFFSRTDPFLANLRDEPRFARLMHDLKREWLAYSGLNDN